MGRRQRRGPPARGRSYEAKNRSYYLKYYTKQAGGHVEPYFAGVRHHGRGLGNVIGSLIRKASPLLSSIGRRVASVGKEVLKDVLWKRMSPQAAVKRRLIEHGAEAAKELIRRKVPRRVIKTVRSLLPEEEETDEDIFATPPDS